MFYSFKVYFIQNGTRKREPTSTPYKNFSSDIDTLFAVPTCWHFYIPNVQMSDSGTYMCIVQPLSAKHSTVNVSMEFAVKSIFLTQIKTLLIFEILLIILN